MVLAEEAAPENLTTALSESPVNDTLPINDSINETPIVVPLTDFMLLNVTPEKAEMGDVILTINVQNTGNQPLKELTPIVSGSGFAAYDLGTIPSLAPGEIGETYIAGRFSREGEILLTIKISPKMFYKKIIVENPSQDDVAAKQREEEQKQQRLQTLSESFTQLQHEYDALERSYLQKKKAYDVSDVDLKDLNEFVNNVQTNLLSKDVDKTNVSLALARNEYNRQKERLDAAQKKPFLNKIKDNIVIISTIAGSLITLFALYEVLRKKQETLTTKVKELAKKKDSKMEVQGKIQVEVTAKKEEGKEKKKKEKKK